MRVHHSGRVFAVAHRPTRGHHKVLMRVVLHHAVVVLLLVKQLYVVFLVREGLRVMLWKAGWQVFISTLPTIVRGRETPNHVAQSACLLDLVRQDLVGLGVAWYVRVPGNSIELLGGRYGALITLLLTTCRRASLEDVYLSLLRHPLGLILHHHVASWQIIASRAQTAQLEASFVDQGRAAGVEYRVLILLLRGNVICLGRHHVLILNLGPVDQNC